MARPHLTSTLLYRFRGELAALFGFGFVVNILMLTQPIFMLQVYDRVLSSGSYDTLLYITLFAVLALVLLGIADAIRGIIASRIATNLEVSEGANALIASMHGPKASLGDVQPLRDLHTVKNFLSGRTVLAFLDLPFSPLFIALLYLVHPYIFWVTLAGALVLVGIALLNQWMTAGSSAEASKRSTQANVAAQSFVRNTETMRAMGMMGNVIRRWGADEAESLNAQEKSNRLNSIFSGISRGFRIALQISVYALGGYLVLTEQMTGGMIIAAALISARGLQPIDQVIGGWRGAVDATRAWSSLEKALERVDDDAETTDLPAPRGKLELEQVVVFPPNAKAGAQPLLKRVSAQLEPGECLVILGPSGAGKSTLARTLIGAIEPKSGAVRLDGSDILNWDREKLGRHMGYLSQDVDLLPGTINENISRFAPVGEDKASRDARDAKVVTAAQKAHVDDLIKRLEDGYDTKIGPGGVQLSGGQRQRLGLARAFYDGPKFIVLDEPNANLDATGDRALEQALADAKHDEVTIVIVTQRRQIAEKADKIMMMREGAVEDFGPRREVFKRQADKIRAAKAQQQEQNKVVTGRFGAAGGAAEEATTESES